MTRPNHGLDTQIVRDHSLRAYEVIFIDPRIDFGGKVIVSDKWLRANNLSLERDGMIYHTLIAIYASFWTGTVEQSKMGTWHLSPPHILIEGVDIV